MFDQQFEVGFGQFGLDRVNQNPQRLNLHLETLFALVQAGFFSFQAARSRFNLRCAAFAGRLLVEHPIKDLLAVVLTQTGIVDRPLRNGDARAPIGHLRGQFVQRQTREFAVHFPQGFLGVTQFFFHFFEQQPGFGPVALRGGDFLAQGILLPRLEIALAARRFESQRGLLLGTGRLVQGLARLAQGVFTRRNFLLGRSHFRRQPAERFDQAVQLGHRRLQAFAQFTLLARAA